MAHSVAQFIPLFTANPALAYHVRGHVNGADVTFLLDTGAALTLLQSRVWERTGAELKQYTGPDLVGADGSPIPVRGSASVTIKLGSGNFEAEVVIVDHLLAEALLGLDFLERNDGTIQTKRRAMSLKNGAVIVPIHTHRSPTAQQIQSRITVNLVQTVHIPAYSEMETLVSSTDKAEVRTTWMVEPASNWKLPVRVARALVTLGKGDVPVHLINPGPNAVTMVKGTTVGLLERFDEANLAAVLPQKMGNANSESMSNQLWTAIKDNQELESGQKMKLHHLLLEFKDIFSQNNGDIGRTSQVQHSIDTGNAPPIRQHTRRTAPAVREQYGKLIQEMLDKDVIQHSSSPWASPVVLARKKDGSVRFCIDYRKLNAVTRKDAYPLPRVDDTLDTLAGSRWFSTLDLISGYWQVEMRPEDRQKTAFCTPEGLFEFKVMPFGLCNAPATFQRLMDAVLMGLQWSRCLVYLDDVVVPGANFDEHLQNLKCVFERFQRAGLKLNLRKCHFGKREVTYLGHVVSSKGNCGRPFQGAAGCSVARANIPEGCSEVLRVLVFIGGSSKTLPKLPSPFTI